MDCCTDGTFAGTGQKFFNCPQGRGMYYLLENLKPSEMNATLKENRKHCREMKYIAIF